MQFVAGSMATVAATPSLVVQYRCCRHQPCIVVELVVAVAVEIVEIVAAAVAAAAVAAADVIPALGAL